MKRSIIILLSMLVFITGLSFGGVYTSVKRMEDYTGTTTILVDSLERTGVSTKYLITDPSSDKKFDAILVGIWVDSFTVDIDNDTSGINDSTFAQIRIMAGRNKYVLVAYDSTVASLPCSLTTILGATLTTFTESMAWDSIWIEVIAHDSAVAVNSTDTVTTTFEWLFREIEFHGVGK